MGPPGLALGWASQFEAPAARPALIPLWLLVGELELLAGEVPARSPGAFDMSGVGGSLAEAVGSPPPAVAPTPPPPTRKTPESFLGPNAALVDLDSLVSRPGPTPPGAKASNPFLPSGECQPPGRIPPVDLLPGQAPDSVLLSPLLSL